MNTGQTMEQRRYREGTATPESLADHLLDYFSDDSDAVVQKIGEQDSILFQIGKSGMQDSEQAYTLGIYRPAQSGRKLIVTLGQQQWISPKMTTYYSLIGLVPLQETIWILQALIWPISMSPFSEITPGLIWEQVETHIKAGKGFRVDTKQVFHPGANR